MVASTTNSLLKPEVYHLYSPFSAADTLARCNMMSRFFTGKLPQLSLDILVTLSLQSFKKLVDHGAPPTAVTFASVVPEAFRSALDLLRENLLSVVLSPHQEGGTLILATSGTSGLALLNQWITFREADSSDAKIPSLTTHCIAIITLGSLLVRLEYAALVSLMPAICREDYALSNYAPYMKWTKMDVSQADRDQISALIIKPLLDS